MTSKRNYCCFFCGQASPHHVEMQEKCECGKSYDLVLKEHPNEIGPYQIERSISRGFYGATYIAKKGKRGIQKVIKVSPTSFYINKSISFDTEVDNHFRAAEGAEYIVEITDEPFKEKIEFSGRSISCHCIEMEYIEGYVLTDILSGKIHLSSELAVQISCDLINILRELQQRELNHNDLHSGNILIEKLKPSAFRADAIDSSVKAKAIDLGSVDSQRREGGQYRSDMQWIADHLAEFASILASDNPHKSDLRARIAFALRQKSLELRAPQAHQSDQPLQDLVDSIRDAHDNAGKSFYRGWAQPLRLSSFSSHRNAQTLESWHVPNLMVDPDEKWLAELNTGGPVVITGMRGCGKTMLLRSLELHARIISAQNTSDDDAIAKETLIRDGYLGIWASARHLGDGGFDPDEDKSDAIVVGDFFARLFLVYARRICDALNHLADSFPGTVDSQAAHRLGATVFGQISRENPLTRTSSLDELQNQLVMDAELWSSDKSKIQLVTEPWNAFVLLAQAVQSVLKNMQSPQILFLLDDVSTRYLQPSQIELVVSTLLVQDPACAFKITSETQTFFLSIKSPAQINQASDERDYISFDLGSKVLDQLKNHRQGEEFLNDILSKRMHAIGGEFSKIPPKQILGDVSLVQIAEEICESTMKGGRPKKVYRGFSALRGVCIGDLGSVIALYQDILKCATKEQVRVPDGKQHDVFQTFCSNQLFQLNNRDGQAKTDFSLKKVALEFAEAAHDEMISSYKNDSDRIRQVTSLNVTLEEGNSEQAKKLLELVDAGVFALHPRKLTTRTKKSNGSDPILQFQLSFRKILGVSRQIGFSNRDRFELTGKELVAWLTGEEGWKNLRAYTRRNSESTEPGLEADQDHENALPDKKTPIQEELNLVIPECIKEPAAKPIPTPIIQELDLSNIGNIDNLIVSLGFEDRCFKSAKRIAEATRPKNILAVEYDIPGCANEMYELARQIGASYSTIGFPELMTKGTVNFSGVNLVDASGLTKPAIYKLIKGNILTNQSSYFAISEPSEFSPTEDDLKAAIGDGTKFWGEDSVDKLTDILFGESMPYELVVVDELNSDPSRNKKLCAFASAKHGRLVHLSEAATFDELEVLLQEGESSRHLVAEKAASIATSGGEMGSILYYPQDNPQSLLKKIFEIHFRSYSELNSNFEIALTGGKMEAVLTGIAGACLPLNRVLYVKPSSFDTQIFSTGIRNTRVYKVTSTSD